MEHGHYTSVTTIGNELFAFNDATVRIAEARDLHHPDAAAVVLRKLTPDEIDELPAQAVVTAIVRVPAPLHDNPDASAGTGSRTAAANTVSFEQDDEVADVVLVSDTTNIVGQNWTLTRTANETIDKARSLLLALMTPLKFNSLITPFF